MGCTPLALTLKCRCDSDPHCLIVHGSGTGHRIGCDALTGHCRVAAWQLVTPNTIAAHTAESSWQLHPASCNRCRCWRPPGRRGCTTRRSRSRTASSTLPTQRSASATSSSAERGQDAPLWAACVWSGRTVAAKRNSLVDACCRGRGCVDSNAIGVGRICRGGNHRTLFRRCGSAHSVTGTCPDSCCGSAGLCFHVIDIPYTLVSCSEV